MRRETVSPLRSGKPGSGGQGTSPVLQVQGLRKVYGGTVALGGINFEVAKGEIHALLGENGAGKSTLVKLVAGIEANDGGKIFVNDEEIESNHNPQTIAAHGVAFLHQQTGLVGDLSVGENIALSAGYPTKWKQINRKKMNEIARQALARMGVDIDPNEAVANLPISAQSIVAIARSLAVNAQVLFLDEPTAVLNFGEVKTLFEILRRLRDSGVSIVMISHRLDEVREVCDRVTVLRDGNVVTVGKMSELSDHEIVEAIIGKSIEKFEKSLSLTSTEVLVLSNVIGQRISGLDLTIEAGQVLGIAGLAGSGHAEIGAMLFGLIPIHSGSITLHGYPFTPKGPSDAMAKGIAYLPADRNGEAAAVELTLRENLYLNPVHTMLSIIRNVEETGRANELLKSFDVRPADSERLFSTLSGGNAQKVVLARWMNHQPKIIILNYPTAAVDVGSRHEIHRRLREAAASGMCVVIITSDLEEVAQVCDRAVIIRAGKVAADLWGTQVNVSDMTRYAYEAA
ncbi:MAG: sugar ABC transporter ATP-binding protein [Ilumatobacteraceae bacterium]|nr:sugar ABC transporter ATP-binding protein [Ilumatobacteraceae bacterium]